MVKKKTRGGEMAGYVHIYMLCSLLAALVLIPGRDLAMVLFTIGGSSGYIAFVVMTTTASLFGSIFSFLWFIFFPVALIVCYILSFKGKYLPFCIVAILDILAVLIWQIYALFQGNAYGFWSFVPDLAISSVYVIIMIVRQGTVLRKTRKTGDGSLS